MGLFVGVRFRFSQLLAVSVWSPSGEETQKYIGAPLPNLLVLLVACIDACYDRVCNFLAKIFSK